jgi:hypothetical protein
MKACHVVVRLRSGARGYAVASQNISHRLVGDLKFQIGQHPHNPVIAPRAVLFGHEDNQFLNCPVDPGSTWASILRAIEGARSLRYHPRIVSGGAAVATSPSALRPSRLHSCNANDKYPGITYGKSQGIVRPVIRAYKKKARIRRYAITIIQRPIVQGVSLITNSHPTTTANAMRIVVLSPGIRSPPMG